ncbi:MAG: hypothetical protein KKB03_01975 [Nanoarchaeota archaeon]|nr:hypothetical protein [Nanoarchaeota archaeon]MBU2519993.1 hypothetical protein [Nanoarchaeota archaeon]
MLKDLRLYPSINYNGKETISIKAITEKGEFISFVPSGASRGVHEVKELSFSEIKKNFSSIRQQLIGINEFEWRSVDDFLRKTDKSYDFSNIGGNLTLAISIAMTKAAMSNDLWRLNGLKKEFPFPLSNLIGGGIHGGGNDFQEFLILPHRAKTIEEAVETNLDVWKTIGEELKNRSSFYGRNLENAWMSEMDDTRTLDFISYITDDWNVKLGVDFAASHLWKNGSYVYKKSNKKLTAEKHFEFIEELIKKYNLFYIEDPFHEEDFKAFAELRKKFKDKLIVGDDLFCTRTARLKNSIKKDSANGAVVKPNQVGLLSKAEEFVKECKTNNITPVMAHRSGETADTFIADLAIAWQTPIIKTAVTGPDSPKINRLMQLWHEVPDAKMSEL